ncbi:MAG: hypothetical protein E6G23_00725 [Actinobacteria bacterium]|nr:MAG: hypothetical protein E6G23_00725 [Actinomycetota bacterium]
MRPGVASGQREGYAAALTGLWKRLSWALTELESIAGDPAELFDEDSVLDRLPSLQYALHAASELALGLRPPAGAEIAHAELAAALAGARDATAEIAEVLEHGGGIAAEPLLPEWRGALFRVRLARLRVATPKPLPAELETEPEPTARGDALASTILALTGATVFATGATLQLWPVWALGLALFASGVLVYSARP